MSSCKKPFALTSPSTTGLAAIRHSVVGPAFLRANPALRTMRQLYRHMFPPKKAAFSWRHSCNSVDPENRYRQLLGVVGVCRFRIQGRRLGTGMGEGRKVRSGTLGIGPQTHREVSNQYTLAPRRPRRPVRRLSIRHGVREQGSHCGDCDGRARPGWLMARRRVFHQVTVPTTPRAAKRCVALM